MTLEIFRSILGWCAIINYFIIIVWFLVMVYANEWLYGLVVRWFHISREYCDAVHYACIAFYKIINAMFFIIPYIVLRFILP